VYDGEYPVPVGTSEPGEEIRVLYRKLNVWIAGLLVTRKDRRRETGLAQKGEKRRTERGQ